jgi:lysyl-tRNA synthetase class 2
MYMKESGPICREALACRAKILRALRAYFDNCGFLECETPVRIPAPANEAFLEPPPSGECWLRTSPELHMKRLLAAGAGRIYQIVPCFRAGECGTRHNPEFTMMEWYRPNEPITALYDDVAGVVAVALGAQMHPEIITVEEAYLRWAGWNPLETWDEDRFDEDMALKIEPSLPKDRLVYLTHYPIQAAALAQRSPNDPRTAERFEAYLYGIEIANGYGELTDPVEQRQRFEATIAKRQAIGLPTYPIDEAFLSALSSLPPTAGIALGIDRLVMAAYGTNEIRMIRPFCEER